MWNSKDALGEEEYKPRIFLTTCITRTSGRIHYRFRKANRRKTVCSYTEKRWEEILSYSHSDHLETFTTVWLSFSADLTENPTRKSREDFFLVRSVCNDISFRLIIDKIWRSFLRILWIREKWIYYMKCSWNRPAMSKDARATGICILGASKLYVAWPLDDICSFNVALIVKSIALYF